ncbi:fatty-acid--CoA ligase [Mesobacillus campisalis]|uniref:Fatty-acid--CoA ligase n=1 Tax=Mesobacillus campisalis TaxID=1408103 RepID=A0A0M2SQR7_9BACI|nr:long-chain fatty acid--CoA ligase [Mesobacillus campisalis]KKK36899.1 fatty-acid--CoA ligase [Mesobacillus campisalis]
MMDTQLTIDTLMVRAEKYFAKKQVISRTATGITRLTYGDFAKRARALASALEKLGVERGDKVGTFAWNDHRHLEAYFAIPSMGAVLHTINIRLSSDHLKYIINDAKDKVLLIDKGLLPIIETIKDDIPHVKAFIILSDEEELPETILQPVYDYETLLKTGNQHHTFPVDLNENDPAGMCYTSATTGNPKGVLYTHRSIVLHSMMLGLADTMALSESDIAMHVVPMFHVNAWGFPFASVWFGTTQVLPGPNFTFKTLGNLIESERVTITAGVPTIWIGLLNELNTNTYDLSSLRNIVCGGSALPKAIIRTYQEKYNLSFIHAYGSTETSPVATVSRLKSYQQGLESEEKLEFISKQGIPVPGIEIKVINEHGKVTQNGKDMGEVLVRGPWITDAYYNQPEKTAEAVKDGWLYTGDIATVDAEGTIKIVDRTKDLIKSGGEWISSVDLENALMAHDAVSEAAVISVPHEKWQERPVAFIVKSKTANGHITKDELLDFLAPQFAKWWLPDDFIFIEEIPKTSVGKFLKMKLRNDYNSYSVSETR